MQLLYSKKMSKTIMLILYGKVYCTNCLKSTWIENLNPFVIM